MHACLYHICLALLHYAEDFFFVVLYKYYNYISQTSPTIVTQISSVDVVWFGLVQIMFYGDTKCSVFTKRCLFNSDLWQTRHSILVLSPVRDWGLCIHIMILWGCEYSIYEGWGKEVNTFYSDMWTYHSWWQNNWSEIYKQKDIKCDEQIRLPVYTLIYSSTFIKVFVRSWCILRFRWWGVELIMHFWADHIVELCQYLFLSSPHCTNISCHWGWI